MLKEEIRQQMKKHRREMSAEEVYEKSRQAQEAFLGTELYKTSKCIMVYRSLGNETDTEELINKAYIDGKKVVFPVTCRESGEITPCFAERGAVFIKGGFSVDEPAELNPADLMEIDVVIVPGIAFDITGNRVGFGKGCYDGFLKKTSAIRVGFGYGFQLHKAIPTTELDIKMDYIITENGIIKCAAE